MEQGLLTLQEHMSSLLFCRGVRVIRSLVLCVCFVDRCLFLGGSCYSMFSFMCMFCRSLFVFSGVRVTRSLVLCVCFVDRCLFLGGFVLLDL